MGCVMSKERILERMKERERKKTIVPHPRGHTPNTILEFDGKGKHISFDSAVDDTPHCGNVTISVITSDRCEVESVYDGVHDGEVLGIGIGGVVRMVTHRKSGAKFALKTLSLDRVSPNNLRQIREEVKILMECDHPNIVKLDGVYQTEEEIYLVQELCYGGDLFDRLDAQPQEHYSEAQCARLIMQILSAVRYIHSKGIIHRDLKLENFLFDHEGPDAELKMIDFGLSKHFKSGDTHHEPVGTRYTIAPEVLRGSYDEKVDIWAVGVITYLLLSGDAPFGGCCEGENVVDIRRKILNADFAFEPEEYWLHVSSQARQFISKLLVSNPKNRPTAEECQHSRWLQEWAPRRDSEGLNPKVLQALRSFRNFSDMRKLLCEVIGFTLLPEQMKLLRKEFEKLDVEQTGEISLEGLRQVLLDNAGNGTLGNFIEEEVEDIFNSLRLHKSDTTIHWHHFLAAGLSELPVDERNHRLAFDKIDQKRRGYITFEDLMELLGPDQLRRTTKSIEGQWENSVELCRAGSQIKYEDFVRMMNVSNDDKQLNLSFST
eukprot:CAMPEP_0203676442 /NCGR_PEP_ID=MMETSP0090-20130426/24550_1 /ASSEMBLY_ACC=CAM_ASM_001088 /TAXON_ID=426623 /ORGANISM="Chaetoceros affinis, Strain CCMP159" /LENGTH=545 /DNA_ID=CAMNT_0050542985 /DNA_START=161 /DNA_END=1798 /DNA_ORIENTATION=+